MQYFAAIGGYFVILGLARLKLIIALITGSFILHILAWALFTQDRAPLTVQPYELDQLYITAAVSIVFVVSVVVYYAFRLAEVAQEETDRLLNNILPTPIVERLKRAPGSIIADEFADASVLFADLKGFVTLAKRLGPARTVELLNVLVSAFDDLAEEWRVEKIKTIGDAYMVAAGRPRGHRRSCRAHGRHGAGDARCPRARVAATEGRALAADRHRLGPGAGGRDRCQAAHLRRLGRYREPCFAPRRVRAPQTAYSYPGEQRPAWSIASCWSGAVRSSSKASAKRRRGIWSIDPGTHADAAHVASLQRTGVMGSRCLRTAEIGPLIEECVPDIGTMAGLIAYVAPSPPKPVAQASVRMTRWRSPGVAAEQKIFQRRRWRGSSAAQPSTCRSRAASAPMTLPPYCERWSTIANLAAPISLPTGWRCWELRRASHASSS